MRLRHGAELDAIEQRLNRGEQVDAEDVTWWSAWARTIPSREHLEGFEGQGEVAEVLLRHARRTNRVWEQLASVALSAGDMHVAHTWAHWIGETDTARWKILVQVHRAQGRFAEAELLLRRQLTETKQTSDLNRGWVLYELGQVLLALGRYAETEQLLRQSLSIDEQTLDSQHPSDGASLHGLASVLERQGRYAEAENLLRQSLAISEQALGPRHPTYAASLHELARVLERQGRYAEAENLLRQSLAIDELALGPQHPSLCPTLANLGINLAIQGRPLEGEPFLLRSVNIARETLGLHHPETAQALSLLARIQDALSKPEAATTARQAMDALLGTLGPEHPITKTWLLELRHILEGGG